MEMKNELYEQQQQPPIQTPSRREVLLKMSEEKRMEKLQKERAKLLEATLMNPEDMRFEEPAVQIPEIRDDAGKRIRTRARVPLRRERLQPPQPQESRQEPPMNMNDMFKDTPFQVGIFSMKIVPMDIFKLCQNNK